MRWSACLHSLEGVSGKIGEADMEVYLAQLTSRLRCPVSSPEDECRSLMDGQRGFMITRNTMFETSNPIQC